MCKHRDDVGISGLLFDSECEECNQEISNELIGRRRGKYSMISPRLPISKIIMATESFVDLVENSLRRK